ncbi:hypothetical protein FKM82_013877 [Ascaphus truei]
MFWGRSQQLMYNMAMSRCMFGSVNTQLLVLFLTFQSRICRSLVQHRLPASTILTCMRTASRMRNTALAPLQMVSRRYHPVLVLLVTGINLVTGSCLFLSAGEVPSQPLVSSSVPRYPLFIAGFCLGLGLCLFMGMAAR